jgi:hypothetical protein
MVKADFWVSEQVVSCSRDARLLFIGLWCFCDDAGVHPASYIRLRMEVFPGDDCTIDDIKRWLVELVQCGLIREYAVSNKLYWHVTGWENHQKIDKPTYRFPLPQSDLKALPTDIFTDNSMNSPRIVDDCSSSTSLVVATKEKKGKEKENKKNIREVETSPDDVSKTNYSASKEEIFSYWQETMNHPRAKLDKKRENVIHKALGLGYGIVDLKQAIDGCAQTPFNMGQNDRQQVYDDISLILRDAEHIERFINNANNPPNAKQINNTNNNIMSGVL